MPWPLIRLLPRKFHFDFVRLAPYAAILSAILIAASGVSFFTKGLNLGIDFRGGTLIEIQTPGPAPLGELRSSLQAMGAQGWKLVPPTAASPVAAPAPARADAGAPASPAPEAPLPQPEAMPA